MTQETDIEHIECNCSGCKIRRDLDVERRRLDAAFFEGMMWMFGALIPMAVIELSVGFDPRVGISSMIIAAAIGARRGYVRGGMW